MAEAQKAKKEGQPEGHSSVCQGYDRCHVEWNPQGCEYNGHDCLHYAKSLRGDRDDHEQDSNAVSGDDDAQMSRGVECHEKTSEQTDVQYLDHEPVENWAKDVGPGREHGLSGSENVGSNACDVLIAQHRWAADDP